MPTSRELERSMLSALRPGTFIGWSDGFDFAQDLEEVAAQIESLVKGGEAGRAAELYAIFIEACHEKAEEVDDSLAMFVEDLFEAWIRARQRSGADPEDTVRFLVVRMDEDPHGFCMNLDQCAAKVMNRAHLEAFARHARTALAEAPQDDRGPAGYPRRRWTAALKRLLGALDQADAYMELCEASELGPEDCAVLSEIHERGNRLEVALTWAERGLELDRKEPLGSHAGYELERRQRTLLLRLGRGGEALELAWCAFEDGPSPGRYEELMQLVPSAERDEWHAKAVAVGARGDLDSAVRLLTATDEIERLAERVDRAPDRELEALSHSVSEPSAALLVESYPGIAARVHRALAVRILEARKSKYYGAALEHLARAREAYGNAGEADAWNRLAKELEEKYRRRSSFMPGFRRVVAGGSARECEESMIERARRRSRR